MKRLCTLFLMSHALLAQGGLNPAKLGAPPTDSWPTYNGDYTGTALQHARQDQPDQHQLAEPGVGLSRQRHARRPERLQRRPHLRDSRPGERRVVLHHAGPRVGGGCAYRPRGVALHVDVARRGAHRQSRRRRVRQLALLPDAGLQYRVAEFEGWLGALAKAVLRSGPVLLRLDGAAGGEEPHHHRCERRRSRPARLHRGARPGDGRFAVALVHGPAEDGRSGVGNLAE